MGIYAGETIEVEVMEVETIDVSAREVEAIDVRRDANHLLDLASQCLHTVVAIEAVQQDSATYQGFDLQLEREPHLNSTAGYIVSLGRLEPEVLAAKV